MVRQRSAKPPFSGSNPEAAFVSVFKVSQTPLGFGFFYIMIMSLWDKRVIIGGKEQYMEDRYYEMDHLLGLVRERFEVSFEDIRIGDICLSILQIQNLEDYIDSLAEQVKEGERLELPFWAKLWPTSLLLSYYLLKLPVKEGSFLLEIGAGFGLCGLVAAMKGHSVILSDIEEDALLFARINVLKNQLEDRCKVIKLDFTKDKIEEDISYIVGSEVLYRQEHYRPLVRFFLRHLSHPHSRVILAKDYHLKAKKFFNLAKEHFVITEKTMGYKEKSAKDKVERHLCNILELRKRGSNINV